ncbi:MAG: NAD kinase [Parvularculaceae bacterium]
MARRKLSFLASEKPEAAAACDLLRKRYGHVDAAEADIIVAVGGDGFMLETLRGHLRAGKPIYGVNFGAVGFLMNPYAPDDLDERIANAESAVIYPLSMNAETVGGDRISAMAINEVSLFRQTRQSARVRILVNGKVRMDSLVCDGVLLSTPAGSTAYNLSAHGPILPIDAEMLALTPISAFRPRRWRGALLPHSAQVRFEALETDQRPVSAVADNFEVRDVAAVETAEDRSISMTLLFDRGQSLEERILGEQFNY